MHISEGKTKTRKREIQVQELVSEKVILMRTFSVVRTEVGDWAHLVVFMIVFYSKWKVTQIFFTGK